MKDIYTAVIVYVHMPHQETSILTATDSKTMFVSNVQTSSFSMLTTFANRSVLTVRNLTLTEDVQPATMDSELNLEIVSDLTMREISSVPSGTTTSVLLVPSEPTSTITECVNLNQVHVKALITKKKDV